jgi:CBS domain-containing protein
VEEAARLMSDHQVRRLVVFDRKTNQPVGVVSLGDLSRNVKEKTSGKTLESISS